MDARARGRPTGPVLGAAKAGSTASALAFLTHILILQQVFKDWLISPVQPYPYASATALTLAVSVGLSRWIRRPWFAPMLGLALLPWLSVEPSCSAVAMGCLLVPCIVSSSLLPEIRLLGAVGLIAYVTAAWDDPASLSALIAGALATLCVDSEKLLGRAWSPLASVLMTGSALAWLAFTWSPILGGSWDDWIGRGIGSSLANTAQRAPLTFELGLGAGCVLSVGVALALLAASAALAKRFAPQNVTQLAMAVGTLVSLTVLTSSGSASLVPGAVGGTLALSLALGLLSVSFLPEPPSRAKRTRPRWLCVVLTLPLLTAATALVWAEIKVDRYLGDRRRLDLSNASPALRDATVAMEDGLFYHHRGFDLIALHRALRMDLRKGRIAQGGSTITQQLAKNLFLENDRTPWRKLKEAFLTVALEQRLSKAQILTEYVNAIDYGQGRRGIRAAAAGYFHKEPSTLTLAESAVLVGLVPFAPKSKLPYDRIEAGRSTAISRIAFFFPGRFSQASLDAAGAVPLERLLYPLKDAWDRHATEVAPPIWHGVSTYFDLAPEEPSPLSMMHASLKRPLEAFLIEAHNRMGLVGIDHIGVYNDRAQRGATKLSAHAFGQAIDLSGFRFANGVHVRVVDHADPRVAALLKPVEALLRRHFDIVVDWREDPVRHGSHFHAEVRGPRRFPSRPPYGL